MDQEKYDTLVNLCKKFMDSESEQEIPLELTTRVITVRLPKVLHEAIKDAAHKNRISMNKFCITTLLGSLTPMQNESIRDSAISGVAS